MLVQPLDDQRLKDLIICSAQDLLVAHWFAPSAPDFFAAFAIMPPSEAM
jgi:hypothetical protein